MKKVSLLYTIIALMLVSVFTVSAAVETVTQYNSATPTFGSNSQAASNPRDDNLANRNIILSAAGVTLKNNNATSSVTIEPPNMTVTYNAPFSSIDSSIQLVSTTPITFTPNQEQSVDFRVRISEKLNAVNEDGDEIAINVAKVTLKDSDSNILGTFDVFIQRENNLEMTNLDATIDGGSRKSLSDDDTLENLKPGERIEIEAEASNRFDRDSNLDVEDITLEIACDPDDNFDFDDKTEDIGDLAPEDEETQTITFDVEPDAEDEDSSCIIKVVGRDQNGARHGEGTNFDIEVTRESHDIQITAATINPTSISCTDRELQLTVDLLNLGRSDEDRVAIEVTSKAISFQERVSNIEMDEDDAQSEIFVIPVNPSALKSGPFAVQVQSFYDNTKSADTETVQVDNLCNAASTGNGNGNNGEPTVPIVQGTLELESESIQVSMGGSTSIPVKVTNLERSPVEYTVALADVSEFAETASSKSIFLNPGQQSTVLLNIRSKEDIDTGKYSGIIVLKDGAGRTLETKTFTVDVTESQGGSFNLNLFGDNDSRIFWIIGDIILIIIAIFFIRLIFTGGKRKQSAKKLADYEAEMSHKKQASKKQVQQTRRRR